MQPVALTDKIHWVGLNDRITPIFEGTWPIKPHGVTYNVYLIQDDKNALIDPGPASGSPEILARVASLMPVENLDYLIINHIEPDHAGAIAAVMQAAPKAVLVGNAKTFDLLRNYYDFGERFMVVKNDDELSLGKHNLKFMVIPFLHWPETMMTYETSEKILFSCDNYGGYGVLKGTLFADEAPDRWLYMSESMRYFTTVMLPFTKPVLKAVEKVLEINPAVIAPSHGLVWRDGVISIVEQYRHWAEMAAGEGEPGVTVLYASMYGNTTRLVDGIAAGLFRSGLPFEIFDCEATDASYILNSLMRYQGVLIGSPAFEGSLMPQVNYMLNMAAQKKLLNRKGAFFGGYTWGGINLERLGNVKTMLGWEFDPSFNMQGVTTLDVLKGVEEFAYNFALTLVK